MDTVREYVQNWVRHHAAPDADLDTLTADLCNEAVAAHPLIDSADFPLTDTIRDALDAAFGTRHDEDAKTPAAVTREELRDDLPRRCADRLGRPVARLVLNENDVGRRDAVFDVALSRPSDTAIDVTFTTTPGSASSGTDFAATSGRITFDPGQTHASVAVPVFADVAVEPRESFGLTVTGADIDKVGRGAAGVTAEAVIRDDDAGAAQDVPTINIAEARRIENTGELLFQITLSRPSSGEVSFDVRTPNLVPSQGVAEAGQDFRAIDGSLTFEAGVTSRVVAVDLFNDDAVEPTEVLQLELSNAQGAAFAGGGNTLTARGVIEDDDTADPTGGLPALTASDVRVEEPHRGANTWVVRAEADAGTFNVHVGSDGTTHVARIGED